MKKIITLFAAAVISLSAMAQEEGFTGKKFLDNWYISVNGGVGAGTTHQAIFENLNGNVGLRLGKFLTPLFGLGIEGNVYFSNRHHGWMMTQDAFIHYSQIGIYATFNMMNAIAGYTNNGPRRFEILLAPALSWGHNYGTQVPGTVLNTFVNKLAIDFCYNFGKKKEFQLYLEPSINYAIAGIEDPKPDEKGMNNNIVVYNINNSYLQLNVGFIYKFKTSNKTHNFKLIEFCDTEEIDRLYDAIEELRKKAEDGEAQVVEMQKNNEALQEKVDNCAPVQEVVEEVKEPDLPTVFYPVNKAVITPAQESNVAIAADVLKHHPEYKLIIKGYASPEGAKDNNNSLGVRRAEAVKTMLVNKFGIAANRITAEGCGETDELFPIYEFNRVAVMFLDKGNK